MQSEYILGSSHEGTVLSPTKFFGNLQQKNIYRTLRTVINEISIVSSTAEGVSYSILVSRGRTLQYKSLGQ